MAQRKRGEKRRKTSAKTPVRTPTIPAALPGGKSESKSVARIHKGPFVPGPDPRRGRGPKPGAPNAGRPPSVIRERCRGSFEDRIVVLEEIADDPKANAGDRIRALDLLGKYGLGTQQQISGPDGGVIPLGVVELPMIHHAGGPQ